MRDESRYCNACDNTTNEWGRDSEGNDVCPDCGGVLYDDYDEYAREMVEWLGEEEGMEEEAVLNFLGRHGNPGKGQAAGIIAIEERHERFCPPTREVTVAVPGKIGDAGNVVTDDIQAAIDDLDEAIEVGVTPRAQVKSAKKRLEEIMEL